MHRLVPAPSAGAELARARRVLSSYAGAVLQPQRAAPTSTDLDPKSAAFRAPQRIDFASLARLPFRTWRYAIVGEIRDPAANRAAARHYGGPVRFVHVTLEFALRGVEPLPSRHDQYFVFTERDGHTYLAGDDALAGESITSWVGPWRYGPLVAVAGARSLVLGPPGDDARCSASPARSTRPSRASARCGARTGRSASSGWSPADGGVRRADRCRPRGDVRPRP